MTDVELAEHFAIVFAPGDQLCVVTCKHKDKEEEPCPASWELEVEEDGSITVGVRNALLSHGRAHCGGFRKMRRIS